MKKLIGNLNLNHGSHEGQALYHSQLYGTFFGIYAFIESKDAGDKKAMTSMTLQVINYKGVLNLGIEEAHYNEGDGTIDITMRAMSGKVDDIPVVGIDKLLVSNGDSLIVRRYLKPIHSEESKENVALKNGVFDEEFHYREGILENQITLKSEHAPNNITGRPTEPEGNFAHAQSGWYCPRSELVLIWL